jgi:hypothetical protein
VLAFAAANAKKVTRGHVCQQLCRGEDEDRSLACAIGDAIKELLEPSSSVSTLAADAARDLVRSRPELVAENALLRQQLIVL